jgi:hypothetical protein
VSDLPVNQTLQAGTPADPIPVKILRLYDMEGNTDCRLVRERITELDLSVDVVIPTGKRSRAVKDRSYEYYMGEGTAVIPCMMVSDRDGVKNLVGSYNILSYLADTFGSRKPIVDENDDEIKKTVVEALLFLSEPLPGLLRFGRGQDVAGCALSNTVPRPVIPLVSQFSLL